MAYQKLALLNMTIATTDGVFSVKTISFEEAQKEVRTAMQLALEHGSDDGLDGLDSAVGHQGTADILTTLLGVKIPVNRQAFKQDVGQKALVLKVNGRPPEGTILTVEEIKNMGYTFKILTRTA